LGGWSLQRFTRSVIALLGTAAPSLFGVFVAIAASSASLTGAIYVEAQQEAADAFAEN
jgi:hypothetical protein